jgi:hypothetical protein
MHRDKMKGHGRKTHEQLVRTFERKDDVPKAREAHDAEGANPAASRGLRDPEARKSELGVSFGGMHQESRDHNKHNKGGQVGHKPQKHTPAEEKH